MGIATEALALAKPKPKVPLVRIGTRFFREVKLGGEKVLIPVDVEMNLDPLEVAKAAAVAGVVAVVGGLVAYVAWEGLTLGTPLGAFRVIEGLKDSPFWKAEAERAQDLLRARRSIQAGGTIVESVIGATEAREDPECELLSREYQKALRSGRKTDAARFLQQAKDGACRWATDL